LLPVYIFMAWIGKTSPRYAFCQPYSLGLLPLSQQHSVSERVSETLHCCGIVGHTVGKVLINKVDKTYGKPLSKIYMIKKFILLINYERLCNHAKGFILIIECVTDHVRSTVSK
jgi:hypothetical protein